MSEDYRWNELCEHGKCECCCRICNTYELSPPEKLEDRIAKGWNLSSDSSMKEGYTYEWVRVK